MQSQCPDKMKCYNRCFVYLLKEFPNTFLFFQYSRCTGITQVCFL